MNDFLNPYTIITIMLFLTVFILFGLFIKKKSGPLKKIINNKKINVVEFTPIRGGFSAMILLANDEQFLFVGHKSGNSNLIQIKNTNNGSESDISKTKKTYSKSEITSKNLSKDINKKPLEQVNISDLLALHKKR